MHPRKYIFVIGGVMSGVGKGVATASIGTSLQAHGYKVNLVKVDPYLNVDAGTMNPTEHGEVFVLESGLETDQDLGNYERFLNRDLTSGDSITSGMIYKTVIDRERSLGYGGKCVEAVPHIRDEIIDRFEKSAEEHDVDITVVEIGGTVGDYQNIMFIEAARVMKLRNPKNVAFVMVTYLPVPPTLGEMKTKPTQNAVRQLNSYGVQPEIILARSSEHIDEKRREKIADSCSVVPENVISAPNIESIYHIPLHYKRDQMATRLLDILSLEEGDGEQGLAPWKAFVDKTETADKPLKIAVVGKYFDTGDFVLSDSYLSVIEATKFSAYQLGYKPEFVWVNSKDFDEGGIGDLSIFDDVAGVIVPGGFGEKGIEGKMRVIEHIRENRIPYLGLCYGMQLMVVEYARNVLGMKDATTIEVDDSASCAVIDFMPEQKKLIAEGDYGGTMRLGAYPALLKEGTVVYESYGKSEVSERHRHRYEVNPDYIEKLSSGDLVFSGTSPDGVLMEFAELPKDKHPFFVGTQAHPELKARPLSPHPLFDAFVKASVDHLIK